MEREKEMSEEKRIHKAGLREDRLFKTHKNLKCRWQWSDGGQLSSKPSQISLVYMYDKVRDRLWTLEAILGHDTIRETVEYTAEVSYGDMSNRRCIIDEEGIKTRLEAQIRAEKLLLEWLKEEYSKIKKKMK